MMGFNNIIGHEEIIGHLKNAFFPRTQQTVTMSLVPIFIKPIAICRPVRLKSVQFRCFIPMIL